MNDPAIREAEATYLANAEVKPQARAALLPALTAQLTLANQFPGLRAAARSVPGGQPIGSALISDLDASQLEHRA